MEPHRETARTFPAGYDAAHTGVAHHRRDAAVLDVTGAARADFLQGQLTQEMRGLGVGETRVAAGLTPKGKLLYVARALGLGDRVRLVLPAQSRGPVLEHLRKFGAFSRVAIEDRSDDFELVALFGPGVRGLAAPDAVTVLPPERGLAGEWLAPLDARSAIEERLGAAGSRELSAETAEVLRVEAGRPAFGRDFGGNNLPDEVGLEEAISTTKGCYVGQEVVARLRTYGRVNRRLVFFGFPEGPVEPGEVLRRRDEAEPSRTEAGRVTSAVESPRLGWIGIGFAFRDVAAGDRLVTEREPPREVLVSELPRA